MISYEYSFIYRIQAVTCYLQCQNKETDYRKYHIKIRYHSIQADNNRWPNRIRPVFIKRSPFVVHIRWQQSIFQTVATCKISFTSIANRVHSEKPVHGLFGEHGAIFLRMCRMCRRTRTFRTRTCDNSRDIIVRFDKDGVVGTRDGRIS